MISALQDEYQGKAAIIVADVGTQEALNFARKFNVLGVPTFVFFDHNGQQVELIEGWYSEAKIREVLDRLVAENS